MGKTWKCPSCGSKDLDIIQTTIKGKWKVFAKCNNCSCGARLIITKHGIGSVAIHPKPLPKAGDL